MKLLVPVVVLLMSLTAVIDLPAASELNYDTKGVYINIDRLEVGMTPLGPATSLTIKDLDQSCQTSITGWDIQEIAYTLALPDAAAPPVIFNPGRLRRLGNFHLAELRNVIKDYPVTYKPEIPIDGRLKPFARFEVQGVERGVNIGRLTVQPFDYDPGTGELFVIDQASINLKFDREMPVRPLDPNDAQYNFFSPIENTGHLPWLVGLSYTNPKLSFDRPLSGKAWYKPSVKYARIATTTDGVASIDASQLIAAQPEFSGKATRHFHLLYLGSEIPLAMANDADGLLNTGDRIYFQGRRAEGDTTWFNTYSKESSYFIYFDENSDGLRLNEFPQAPTTQSLNSVRIDRHYEVDTFYSWGCDNILETEKVAGENWFWKKLTPWYDNEKSFNLPLILAPSEEPGSRLIVTAHVESMEIDNSSDKVTGRHKLDLIINSETVRNFSLDRNRQGDITDTLDGADMLSGANSLEVLDLPVFNDNNQPVRDGVGLDYITVKGMVKPFAENARADIYVDQLPGDRLIDIAGFSDPGLVLIDTINNYVSYPGAAAGARVLAGAMAGSRPNASIIINDSLMIAGTDRGLYIAYLTADSKSAVSRFFTEPNAEASGFIKSIPDRSVIVALSNSNGQSTQDFINAMTTLGSSLARDISGGKSWAFSAIKGDNSTAAETISSDKPTNISRFLAYSSGSYYSFRQELKGGKSYRLIAGDGKTIETATAWPVDQSDWLNYKPHADMIIVTHSDLRRAADSLAAHRQRTNPGLTAVVADVDDLYKEFNFGNKSPHAIKAFLENAYRNWAKPSPRYLVLFGDANYDSRNLAPGPKFRDLVPVYGWPNSDYWYTLLDGNDILPEMVAGRIPAKNEAEAFDYLDKVIEHDTLAWSPWMKKFLFLSGGKKQDDEAGKFLLYLFNIATGMIDESNDQICCDTVFIPRQNFSDGSVSETEGPSIRNQINNGVMWTTFFGHASAEIFDLDGWQADKLNNKGKYGFLSTLSCNTGAFAEYTVTSRNEEYLLQPHKGFVCVGGGTATGYSSADYILQYNVMKQIGSKNPNFWTYGDMLNRAKTKFKNEAEARNTAFIYNLLGDPSIQLKYSINPDIYISGKDVSIKNKDNQTTIVDEDDSVTVTGLINNPGFYVNQMVRVLLVRQYNDRTDSLLVDVPGVCKSSEFSFKLDISGMPGAHKITIVADPFLDINDPNRINNRYETVLEVLKSGLLALEPLSHWNINHTKPEFRFINPLSGSDDFDYNFKLLIEADTAYTKVYESIPAEIEINENFLDWKPGINLEANAYYQVQAFSQFKKSGTKANTLIIPFNTMQDNVTDTAGLSIGGFTGLMALRPNGFEVSKGKTNGYGLSVRDGKVHYRLDGTYKDDTVVIAGISIPRYVYLMFNDKVYFEAEGWGTTSIGLNLVVADKDFNVKHQKEYYTFPDYFDPSPQIKTAIEFVDYLRDSVNTGDYVLIASCETAFFRPWNTFLKTSKSSIDTLKAVLKEMGSKYIDMITEDMGHASFVMISRKGDPDGSIAEKLDTSGHRIFIEGFLPDFRPEADLESPIIGPAKKWSKIRVDADFPTESVSDTLKVFGYTNGKSDEKLLISSAGSLDLDLDTIDAGAYPYLRLRMNVKRSDVNKNVFIKGISAEFVPTPEFAVIKSKFSMSADTLLRGEYLNIGYSLENISKRTASETNSVKLSVFANTVGKYVNDQPLVPLEAGQSAIFFDTLMTDNFDHENTISVDIDAGQASNELYLFNNKLDKKFFIREDDIKPEIILKLDSIQPRNGDFVSVKPWLEVELLDQSPLAITDSSKIEVRINSIFQDPAKYIFRTYGRNTPLKATVAFRMDSLMFEDNYILVTTQDATGNRDTLEVKVYVSQNGVAYDLRNAPNPLTTSTSFMFNYKAPENGEVARIEIFNYAGQKIRSLQKLINNGGNVIEWDGNDDNGNRVPQGAYLYRMSFEGSIWVEPVFGKLIVIGS